MKQYLVAFLLALLALLALCECASAQNLTNIYGAGISYNGSGSPKIAGSALYARLVNDGSGTYAFTVVDALPANVKPFTVTTNMGVGIAQKLFTIGKVPIYMPVSPGISFSGSNVGWQWSGGVLASVRLKGNFRVFPNVRFLNSSISGGYQPIAGLMFGWGQ